MTAPVLAAHRQHDHRVRFDWGSTGAAAVAADADIAVVVDVLSFTTTVSVAVERGAVVLPYPWRDERAASYAAERGASLAEERVRGLSPAAMARVAEGELVLVPSPNGSSIAFGLADQVSAVVAASLRNRAAVARWVLERGGTVAVVAAGERWPDATLRPCAEDLWGAGAVLSLLAEHDLSPEARLAADAFRAVAPRLSAGLRGCAGGRELSDAGFAEDVELAAGLDAADVVPVLVDAAFRALY